MTHPKGGGKSSLDYARLRNRVMKFSILLILVFFALPLASQDYQVTVSSVHVWVKATKNGEPVSGLTQNDFTIYEDGVKVPITCFEEQVIAGTPAGATPQKNVDVVSKKFVLFLDLYNTSSRELLSIRPNLLSFIDSISNGGHEVMLAALMPNGKLGVIAPFTKDLNRIRILVNKAPAGTDRNIVIRRNMDELNRIINTDDGAIGKAGTALVDKIRDAYQLARTYARQDQDISEFTLAAVQQFSEYLSQQSLGEDPVVVYVSGGFSVDPGRQYYDIVYNLASTARSTEEFSEISKVTETNMDMRNEIKKTFGKLNRMNVTFYTIDTGGLGGASEYQDSLVEMAEQTGGTSFYNSQNFQLGFNQVVTDLNQQYLLCFQAPVHKKPGEYHNIQVKTSAPGVDLRYRKGYID
jgi:VWFA-related protein